MDKYLWSLIVLPVLVSLTVCAEMTGRSSSTRTSSRQVCPTITIKCPEELPQIGQTYTVSATVQGTEAKQKLSYHWTLSSEAGEIVEGQGTPVIKVRVKYTYETITATVEVCGLLDKCQKMASCSFVVE